jgi:hypothetical protein
VGKRVGVSALGRVGVSTKSFIVAMRATVGSPAGQQPYADTPYADPPTRFSTDTSSSSTICNIR